MAILTAYGLAKSFGEKQLFEDVSFELFPADRVGLVGVNGSGKTTLFRILSGEETPTKGSVSVAKFCRVAMLEQSPEYPAGISLFDDTLLACEKLMNMERRLEEIENELLENPKNAASLATKQADLRETYELQGGLTYRSRARAALLGLGFDDDDLARPIASMSGGQMRKAALAKTLLSGAELILLDEPTNHLDIAAIEWLEAALGEYRGACVVISHDRYFLDAVTTRTFELENGLLRTANLPYSRFVEQKLDQREVDWRHYRNTLKEIKRIEGIIAQQRRWNQERNYVTIASKQKQIDRIRAGLVRPEAEPDEIHFQLHADPLTCNEVICCQNLSMRFKQEALFQNCDLLLHRDECVVLAGANGCGKTTLLNILLGNIEPAGGVYRIGPGVRIGYFSQATVHEQNERSILDEMQNRFPLYDIKSLRNLLGSFLFRGDDVFKRMDALSGGEFARIQLLTLMLKGSNVLLLDEPTNHLDIASCEALEKALDAYGGSMLIVTHDRYLANRLADRIVVMGYNGMEEFCGDWDDYKSALLQRPVAEPKTERKKNGYTLQREKRQAVNRAKGVLDRAEQAVCEGEAQMRRLEEALSDPENASNAERITSLCVGIEQLRHDLEQRYAAWEAGEREYFDIVGKDDTE